MRFVQGVFFGGPFCGCPRADFAHAEVHFGAIAALLGKHSPTEITVQTAFPEVEEIFSVVVKRALHFREVDQQGCIYASGCLGGKAFYDILSIVAQLHGLTDAFFLVIGIGELGS